MSEPQAQGHQAEPSTPVKTVGDQSREKRDSTLKARQAKAAKRFAARNGDDPEPEKPEEPEDTKAKEEPEAKADEQKTEEKPPERNPKDIDKRHAIAERREKRVTARESKVKEREDKVSRAEHNLQTRYGDPDAAKKAYESGQFYEAAKYVQRIFGDDYATITQKIARATAGLSPEKLKELEERDQFAREKREFEARKKREEEEKNAGTTREKAISHVAEKCAGHDVLKLKNGAALTLAVLEKHWDSANSRFTVTFKQAADMVLADKLAEAEALGLKRHTAVVVEKPKPEPEPSKPARTVRHKPPAASTEKKTGRLSFEERHALAGRKLAQRRSL